MLRVLSSPPCCCRCAAVVAAHCSDCSPSAPPALRCVRLAITRYHRRRRGSRHAVATYAAVVPPSLAIGPRPFVVQPPLAIARSAVASMSATAICFAGPRLLAAPLLAHWPIVHAIAPRRSRSASRRLLAVTVMSCLVRIRPSVLWDLAHRAAIGTHHHRSLRLALAGAARTSDLFLSPPSSPPLSTRNDDEAEDSDDEFTSAQTTPADRETLWVSDVDGATWPTGRGTHLPSNLRAWGCHSLSQSAGPMPTHANFIHQLRSYFTSEQMAKGVGSLMLQDKKTRTAIGTLCGLVDRLGAQGNVGIAFASIANRQTITQNHYLPSQATLRFKIHFKILCVSYMLVLLKIFEGRDFRWLTECAVEFEAKTMRNGVFTCSGTVTFRSVSRHALHRDGEQLKRCRRDTHRSLRSLPTEQYITTKKDFSGGLLAHRTILMSTIKDCYVEDNKRRKISRSLNYDDDDGQRRGTERPRTTRLSKKQLQ
ncbi:hypothetical protein Scep_012115 [Stephania cephalantha]|uniref:Uncharacterized protein n=1 Tax=Stephania cephalantha TaxID=152367 RepID=A0AAP0JGP0_9MAGN